MRATIQALGEAQAQLDTAEQTARQQFDAAWNELNERGSTDHLRKIADCR